MDLDENQRDLAGKLAGVGLNLNQIAAILEVSPSTLDRLIARDESLAGAIEKGRASASTKVMQTAFKMATSGKDTGMTIFWLKTREQWSEKKADRSIRDEILI